MKTPRKCFSCESGTIRLASLKGRSFDYRDEFALVFDEKVEAPICDSCGELFLRGGLTAQFEAVLERLRAERKRTIVKKFISVSERDFPDVPRALWEDALGVSHGYLSRLVSGKKLPDTSLTILLAGFAKEPKRALELFSVSGHMPQELKRLTQRAVATRRAARV